MTEGRTRRSIRGLVNQKQFSVSCAGLDPVVLPAQNFGRGKIPYFDFKRETVLGLEQR